MKTETTKTEMAENIIDDGQSIRSIWNYLNATFEDIKDVELFDATFKTREEFYGFVKNVCEMMLDVNRETILDEAE